MGHAMIATAPHGAGATAPTLLWVIGGVGMSAPPNCDFELLSDVWSSADGGESWVQAQPKAPQPAGRAFANALFVDGWLLLVGGELHGDQATHKLAQGQEQWEQLGLWQDSRQDSRQGVGQGQGLGRPLLSRATAATLATTPDAIVAQEVWATYGGAAADGSGWSTGFGRDWTRLAQQLPWGEPVVYEAYYRRNGEAGVGERVAVKELLTTNINDTHAFYNELQMLASLQTHPNVVHLFGMIPPPGPDAGMRGGAGVMLVTEYMPHSLRVVLDGLMSARVGARAASAARAESGTAAGTGPGVGAALRMLQPERLRGLLAGVARGMAFIHSRGIIHRDLKPSNILVADDDTVKLCDFGIARHLKSKTTDATMTGQQGSPRYMAPEIIRSERARYTQRVDVYSFGITMYECCCGGQDPYGGLTAFEIMEGVTAHKLRPAVPDRWPVSLQTLLAQLWAEDPCERPSFAELESALEDSRNVELPTEDADVQFLQSM
eukprot:g4781.t1